MIIKAPKKIPANSEHPKGSFKLTENLGQNTMENDPNLSVNLTQTLGPFYSAFWPRFLTSLKDTLGCLELVEFFFLVHI